MKNNERVFLDLHVIQTVPPSNINRDDTGSPKTAQYGGVRRARVSSQSWKRAIRTYFNINGRLANVGKRTLDIVKYVAEEILKLEPSMTEEDAKSMAKGIFEKLKVGLKNDKAKALFFLGHTQAEELAKAALAGVDSKEDLEAIMNSNQAIDIALFGRMAADNALLNEDASCQVAHAISTHAVQNEFDFFTAIDDLSPEENTGAGMLGNIEFNSSTLYRYANVAIHEFVKQVGSKEEVIKAIKLFVEAFANSLPTGKSNTFANQTLPQFILVNLRNDRPITLVNAFERPVNSSEGYVRKSIEKLAQEFKNTGKFVDTPILSLYISVEDINGLSEIGREKGSLNELLDQLAEELLTILS